MLIATHASSVLTVAWRMLGNRAAAEDAAQDTFLAAYRALATFRTDARFSTWLYRIAINKCRDVLRTRSSRRAIDGASGPDGDPAPEPAGDSLLHRTPEQRLLADERARYLADALSRLPDLYREAFVLRHVEDLSYEEMSEILGVDGGTLRMRVYKARKELSERLAALVTK